MKIISLLYVVPKFKPVIILILEKKTTTAWQHMFEN